MYTVQHHPYKIPAFPHEHHTNQLKMVQMNTPAYLSLHPTNADVRLAAAKQFTTYHHNFFSNQTMLALPMRKARYVALTDLAATHTRGTLRKAIEFCAARVDAGAERVARLQRFNGRWAAKSYFLALFPQQVNAPPAQVLASKLLVGRLERLIEVIAAAVDVDDVQALLCTGLLDAVEGHIRVFGEERPKTPDERKEERLAEFEMLLFNVKASPTPQMQAELGQLRFLLDTLGWGAEVAMVEDIVRVVG